MTFPNSHKTVIVLDHGPYFAEPCKQSTEFDVFNKSRSMGIIPLAPITKSLWTCNVEATLEYCRIMFDLFPTNKVVKVIVSDTSAKSMNSWEPKDQNLPKIMDSLASVGPPSVHTKSGDSSVMHGLSLAVESLCQPTHIQQEVRTALMENADSLINRGRIICITSIRSEEHEQTLEDCVLDAIIQHSKLAASSDNLLPIDHCELVFIHINPVGNKTNIGEKDRKEIASLFSSELHVSESGRFIANKLVELVQKHYGLFSTSVTGIPMKEEQNASSSANYDVELLHSAEAHKQTLKSDAKEGLISQSRENPCTSTVALKWCTPKSNVIELQNCTGAYRITPVDVNSRPSQCLTNFLLSGRAVMLEQIRKSGRVMSHMLASHGGEIYIHVLNTNRSILEEPPSISEGAGGRVTDYRITDFGEFMKENRLAPSKQQVSLSNLPSEYPSNASSPPILKAKAQLERMTRHWPIVIGDTIIFNMTSHIHPLPSLIVKEQLDDDDVLECKKAIYHVVGMEARNDPLPVPNMGSRGKGPKRDEQYRQMWSELELLIRAHMDTSPQHMAVLNCLMDCKAKTDDGKRTPSSPKKNTGTVKEEKMQIGEADAAFKELEKLIVGDGCAFSIRYEKMSHREKDEFNKDQIKKEPGSFEPPLKKSRLGMETAGKSGPQSLLSLWTNRIKATHASRHKEFDGRLESVGNKAELYRNLKEENNAIVNLNGTNITKRTNSPLPGKMSMK